MDIVYIFDTKRRVVVDEYEETLLPIVLDRNKEEDVASIIHYAIQHLNRIGKEKFGSTAELETRQIFMNDEMLVAIQKSSLWASRSDAEDLTIMGELYKIGVVHEMKTLSGSRVQLYMKVNAGGPYRHTLFGLIDII